MSDGPLLVWVRLVDGRLWHVEEHVGLWTGCGRLIRRTENDQLPETLADAPPANGWVCDRCVRRLAEQAAAARQAWLQDPRRRPGDELPVPDADSPPDGEIRANNNPAEVTPDGPDNEHGDARR